MTDKNIKRLQQLFNLYGINYAKEDIKICDILNLDDEILFKIDSHLTSKSFILKTLRKAIALKKEEEVINPFTKKLTSSKNSCINNQ